MFDWSGVPLEFFDLYMEAGDVKAVSSEDAESVSVEVWISCRSSRSHIRPECANIRRVPIYALIRKILRLCGEKQAIVLFMCDDSRNPGSDTVGQSGALCMILRELIRLEKLRHAVLYTGYFREQIIREFSGRFFREADRQEFIRLYRLIDVLILCQPNRHSPAANRQIISGKETIREALELMPE